MYLLSCIMVIIIVIITTLIVTTMVISSRLGQGHFVKITPYYPPITPLISPHYHYYPNYHPYCSKGEDAAAREALEWLRGTNRVDQVIISTTLL